MTNADLRGRVKSKLVQFHWFCLSVRQPQRLQLAQSPLRAGAQLSEPSVFRNQLRQRFVPIPIELPSCTFQ